MKTHAIVPAQVDFSGLNPPHSPQFEDLYHPRAGAFAQAQHVFLRGNGLPERWQGRPRFVILETGFGLGNNFLATWSAWRQDTQACERLIFISIEKHPLRREDLRKAHAHSPAPELAAQLVEAWPPLTHNLHLLDFEGGRVRLMLALGDARDWLRELVAEVNAFYLDGFSPAQNPDIWDRYTLKLLARLAVPGASVATWCASRSVREALTETGFRVDLAPGFANKSDMTLGRFVPRHTLARPAGRQALAPTARHVLVIGAGLAGAACADALARHGVDCTLLETLDAPAQAASGNPGGLFHGTLNPNDGLHARFNRGAALLTGRLSRQLHDQGALPWLQQGLLRLETQRSLVQMQAVLQQLGLPADYVQALDSDQAARMSGWPLRQPAWFYPGGGALAPGDYVRALLARSAHRARLCTRAAVATLQIRDAGCLALDAQGQVLAQGDAVVITAGAASLDLARSAFVGAYPESTASGIVWPDMVSQRGQITQVRATSADLFAPALPLAGTGYALAEPGPDGVPLRDSLFCGATTQDHDLDPQLRASDQAFNLQQLRTLSGMDWPEPEQWTGRVGWRAVTADKLPLVGALGTLPADGRNDQVRLLPRLPGLLLCTGLASRGITWAALCGELAASQLLGTPRPVEASLLDAVDPMRFAVRQSRGA
ncbi:MAG: FAD-dependent 5-carboxymethylaminomethyl-2-thiouridine(34) oxidoreductase MnmC [Burkholderiaceae bacterium]|nr:FAD-dependent 5-carboxymethylaminomethyl-2-thiouridine(34) oxidoreductase MnmC [Roseateles sp.]MBV8470372.1 FAD-dependent 5-carboxymethylaminomethyl-2-thiouridine(34) oxidoreductase MnmC [Burkholderiaceae bacterium]